MLTISFAAIAGPEFSPPVRYFEPLPCTSTNDPCYKTGWTKVELTQSSLQCSDQLFFYSSTLGLIRNVLPVLDNQLGKYLFHIPVGIKGRLTGYTGEILNGGQFIP